MSSINVLQERKIENSKYQWNVSTKEWVESLRETKIDLKNNNNNQNT